MGKIIIVAGDTGTGKSTSIKSNDEKRMINFDTYISRLFIEAYYNINNYVEMLYISAKSKPNKDNSELILNKSLIEDYLKRRGYVENIILKKCVYVKGFVCVYVDKNYIELWHDKTNNNNKVYVSESLLTGLPIALNYMEKLN